MLEQKQNVIDVVKDFLIHIRDNFGSFMIFVIHVQMNKLIFKRSFYIKSELKEDLLQRDGGYNGTISAKSEQMKDIIEEAGETIDEVEDATTNIIDKIEGFVKGE